MKFIILRRSLMCKYYVECMWLTLQQERPEDFVIATGEQHTLRDFTASAFRASGIELRWEGAGKMPVCVNPEWFRPTDDRMLAMKEAALKAAEIALDS